MKKTSRTIAVALLVMLFISTTVSAASFPDVPANASYAKAVNTLVEMGIIRGYEDGTFRPEGRITRGEFSKVICVMINGADDDTFKTKPSGAFFDDTLGHWAEKYIEYAVSLGLINGYGNGNFGPDDTLTYAQALKIVVCHMGYDEGANRAGGWPYGYEIMADDLGLTKNIFAKLDDEVTRGEVCLLLYNMSSGTSPNTPPNTTPNISPLRAAYTAYLGLAQANTSPPVPQCYALASLGNNGIPTMFYLAQKDIGTWHLEGVVYQDGLKTVFSEQVLVPAGTGGEYYLTHIYNGELMFCHGFGAGEDHYVLTHDILYFDDATGTYRHDDMTFRMESEGYGVHNNNTTYTKNGVPISRYEYEDTINLFESVAYVYYGGNYEGNFEPSIMNDSYGHNEFIALLQSYLRDGGI